jgi:hypothetical protein
VRGADKVVLVLNKLSNTESPGKPLDEGKNFNVSKGLGNPTDMGVMGSVPTDGLFTLHT